MRSFPLLRWPVVGFPAVLVLAAGPADAQDADYTAKGMVNIPLIGDQLALRLVGLQRFEAGHLDNTLLGEDGSNDLTVQGYRASVV